MTVEDPMSKVAKKTTNKNRNKTKGGEPEARLSDWGHEEAVEKPGGPRRRCRRKRRGGKLQQSRQWWQARRLPSDGGHEAALEKLCWTSP